VQQWEYLVVTFASGMGTVPTLHKLNGEEQRNWQNGEKMSDCLKRLGNEGWDLLTVDAGVLYFKRPKTS
jgi:hypothetical protein